MSLQVGFLRGKQSSVDALLAQSGDRFQAGAFYITEDSNRIYFAQSATDLQYLNKYITTVATVSDLPATLPENCIGDFYYIADGNILCRYDGDNVASGVTNKANWTQVNAQVPDTDTTNKVASLAIGDGVLNTEKETIEFTLTATEQKYDVKSNTAVGAAYDIVTDTDKKFVLNKSILDNWYNLAAIDLNATVDTNNNKATVKLNGTGAVSDNEVTITGGANVTIAANGTDGIKISATDTNTTYSMVSPANQAKIHLDSSVGVNDAGTVEFIAGTDLTVDGSVEGQITYGHAIYTNTSETITKQQNPQQGTSFDIVSGVTTSNGHVTNVHTRKVQLPEITDVNVGTDGKINVVVTDGSGSDSAAVTISSEATGLKVGDTLVPLGGDLKAHFYTENEIDTKFADHLKSVNAMVFKGALPAAFPSNPSIGDTYIVTVDSSLAIEGKTLQKGDIVIASGEENDNGVITDPTWILVESNEIDTTYTLEAVGDFITLTPSTSAGADDQVQKIQLTDDGVVTLSTNNKAIKAEHSKTNPLNPNPSTITALNYADANGFLVVTGVDANEYGHITTIDSARIQLPGAQTLSHNSDTKATELKEGKAGSVVGSINVNGSGVITVDTADNGKGTNYTVKHNELTSEQKVKPIAPVDASATLLAHEGYFTAITDAIRDAYGHVTGYTVSKYKLPADNNTTYELSGAVATEGTNGVKITDTLTDNISGNEDAKSEFVLKSDNANLTVTASAEHEVTLGLIWGSF